MPQTETSQILGQLKARLRVRFHVRSGMDQAVCSFKRPYELLPWCIALNHALSVANCMANKLRGHPSLAVVGSPNPPSPGGGLFGKLGTPLARQTTLLYEGARQTPLSW